MPHLSALSADIAVFHYGTSPASVDNVTSNPAQTILSLGGRYRFKAFGKATTLRVQLQNVTQFLFLEYGLQPRLTQFVPRVCLGYVTTDF